MPDSTDGCVYAFMDALNLPLTAEQLKAAQDWKEDVAREREACGGQIVQAHSMEEVMGIRDCWIRPRSSKNHSRREIS
jgi:hypothetical protein